MYGNSDRKNMAQRHNRYSEYERGEKEEVEEYDGGTGTYHKTTRFSDGSSITHFGGPAGSVRTNKYGEEC